MFDVRVRVLIFMTARRLGSTGSAPVGQIEPFTSINLPTLSTVPRNRERTSPREICLPRLPQPCCLRCTGASGPAFATRGRTILKINLIYSKEVE